jgi:hypothetical protein
MLFLSFGLRIVLRTVDFELCALSQFNNKEVKHVRIFTISLVYREMVAGTVHVNQTKRFQYAVNQTMITAASVTRA